MPQESGKDCYVLGKCKRGLTGLRVLSLESRRADEMAKLIESRGHRRCGSIDARDPSPGPIRPLCPSPKTFSQESLMS